MSYFNSAGRVLSENSTNAPLAVGQTFTGQWTDVSAYDSLSVAVAASHAGLLVIEFSADGMNLDYSVSRSYRPAPIQPPERLIIGHRYTRVTFTNHSGVSQSYFRLQALVGAKAPAGYALDRILPQHADAIAVRNDSFPVDVVCERREGIRAWHQAGFNADIDAASIETVWSPGGRWQPLTSAQTLSVVSSSVSDTAAGTGLRTAKITGVGAGYAHQSEIITLNGTTPVITTQTWLGVNRIEALSCGSDRHNVGDITVSASTSATVQAGIPATASVSQQALFICPADRSFLLTGISCNVNRTITDAEPRVSVVVYEHDFSASTVKLINRFNIDTKVVNFQHFTWPHPQRIRASQAIEVVIGTSIDDTIATVNFWGLEVEES